MAKKKPKKRTPAKKTDTPKFSLSADAKREIIAIVLITLAILILLASVGWAGAFGTSFLNFLKILIGLAAYILPLALVLIAWVLFQPDRFSFKRNNLFGILAFFVFLAGLLAVVMTTSGAAFNLNTAKAQGGIVGYGVSAVILPFLNKPVAIIVLVALILISLVVAADTRIKTVLTKVKEIFRPKRDEEIKIHDPSASVANRLPVKGFLHAKKSDAPPEPKEESALTTSTDANWEYPPIDLLEVMNSRADAGDVKANAKTIASTLSQFGIDVSMENVNIGPTVTQYTLKPAASVKLSKITALDRNLALALAAQTIRIEAPIPGKSVVGIEVPNKKAQIVKLREFLESDKLKKDKNPLTFALGRDVSGEMITANMEEMPHVLIAGTTRSGKSMMINAMITCLLYRNSPDQLKLILVDPKRVELTKYDGIPHLLAPVIAGTDVEKTISALKWSVAEAERRFDILMQDGTRDIGEYNKKRKSDRMPYIVLIIDELNDLMSNARKEIEAQIVRIAQKGRAAGIHLVLATQRPDVNVITGVIKANVPARIGLKTASQVDSRTILDKAGAEKLLGYGDMLYLSPDQPDPKRIQGILLPTKEVEAVTGWLKKAGEPSYNEEVLTQSARGAAGGGFGGGGDYGGGGDDELFEQAVEIILQRGKASASDLQRRLRIGYGRAGRLMDMLEERGVVGPQDGARPRAVLINSMADIGGDSGETEQ